MKCWICDSANVSLLWKSEIGRNLNSSDVAITNDKYGQTLTLYKCNDCGFSFAHPVPDNIIELYEELEDESYVDGLTSRFYEMKHLSDFALKCKPDAKSGLDVGAGVGLMVKALKEKNIDATGVEPSKWLVKKSKEIFDIDLIEGIVPNESIAGKKFDLVFAVDVIEHLSNPVEFLNTLKSYLNENGILIIATPDRDSLLAKFLGKKWWHYRIAHIGYFNHNSMELAIKKSGMRVEKFSRPVWCLPLGYLSKRLSKYLPVKSIASYIEKKPELNNRPVNFNLHDSIAVIVKK